MDPFFAQNLSLHLHRIFIYIANNLAPEHPEVITATNRQNETPLN